MAIQNFHLTAIIKNYLAYKRWFLVSMIYLSHCFAIITIFNFFIYKYLTQILCSFDVILSFV